jgi:hypothetical protein
MDRQDMERVQLLPEVVLVATTSAAWIEAADAAGDLRVNGAADGRTGVAITRKLLDGAVGTALSAAVPAPVPAMSETRWVFRLAGLYHLTARTPALLREASVRFAAAGRVGLARWASQKAREERNHDLLALRDLEELGYRAQDLVREVEPAIAARLVRFFEASVKRSDPIGCVGYSYALERLAMTVSAADVLAVEAVLPAGSRATRCLRVHSALGSDRDHVDDTVELVASLSAAERAAVAVACYRAARLCFEVPPGGHPSDADLEPVFRRLRAPSA